MGVPRLRIRPGNPDFLDLPWEAPISKWEHPRLVEMPSGIHRHPVVFVAYDEGIYAIKELSHRRAAGEFEVLEVLEGLTNRAAVPAGLVERNWIDPRDEQAAAVITRFVEHAFPYRHLVVGTGFGHRRDQMLDAVASLMVELHIGGCFWGDCSLSNVLCRFDAGGLEAIMIDGETSELHPSLSDGQRRFDLEIMTENVAGEMADIAAMNDADLDTADLGLGDDIANRYEALWGELNDELVITRDEGYRIRERVARLNELGFAVHDIDIEPTDVGGLVRMTTRVGGRTFNSDRLRELTGVDASENQAKILLGDLNYYLVKHEATTPTGKNVGTFRWLNESFEPMVSGIREVWDGDDPIQGYCDFLNHRMRLARSRQADVTNAEAFESWVAAGFPGFDPA